jgi:osmotically-inducible protein OsmY
MALGLALSLFSFTLLPACKDKKKEAETTTTTTTPAEPAPAPVQVDNDADIRQKLTDATKDFPGVTATVSNGEVTLTGTVERDRLPKLMQSVHSLNPRKVNNQLTIK